MLARDPICVLCGVNPSTECDHIDAMADVHTLESCQGVCTPCHRKKSSAEGRAAQTAKRNYLKIQPERHPGLK